MSHHTTRSIKKKLLNRQNQVILPLSLKCIMFDLLIIISYVLLKFGLYVGIAEIEEDNNSF